MQNWEQSQTFLQRKILCQELFSEICINFPELRKNEEIKLLKESLHDVKISDDGDSNESLNTSCSVVHSRISDLRSVNECLHEKCSTLQDENYELVDKVWYYTTRMYSGKYYFLNTLKLFLITF